MNEYDKHKLESLVKRVCDVMRERAANTCENRVGAVSMFANSRDASTHNRAVLGVAEVIRKIPDVTLDDLDIA